jgi:hypothetical protein
MDMEDQSGVEMLVGDTEEDDIDEMNGDEEGEGEGEEDIDDEEERDEESVSDENEGDEFIEMEIEEGSL